MKKALFLFILCLFSISSSLSVSSVAADNRWAATSLGLGYASLSGDGLSNKNTAILRANWVDYQTDKFAFNLSMSCSPSSDAQYTDVKALYFYGWKFFQIGTGFVYGGAKAKSRDTQVNLYIPGVYYYDKTKKEEITAGGIPIAVRIIPVNSSKDLLRVTGYYTIIGRGYARIPIRVLDVEGGYLSTHGKGRYAGVEVDYLRKVSKHVAVGLTGFYTNGKAYDLDEKDWLGHCDTHAPDTSFERTGAFLVIGFLW
jgi:hypothetical protein